MKSQIELEVAYLKGVAESWDEWGGEAELDPPMSRLDWQRKKRMKT